MGGEVIPLRVRHPHTANDAAFHRQRDPHPGLHPVEQDSRPIVQKGAQKLRLRIVSPHVGDANGTVAVEQRGQVFGSGQVNADGGRCFQLRRPAHGQGNQIWFFERE